MDDEVPTQVLPLCADWCSDVQESIPGPMFFNLYVDVLYENLPRHTRRYQHADDTNIYASCPASALRYHTDHLNSSLSMHDLSLPWTLQKQSLCCSQLAKWYVSTLGGATSLTSLIAGKALERVSTSIKAAGLAHTWTPRVMWNRPYYGVLRILCKIKHRTLPAETKSRWALCSIRAGLLRHCKRYNTRRLAVYSVDVWTPPPIHSS